MTTLRLLTAEDCHLCDHAKTVLGELGTPWREVAADSDEGRRLAAAAPPLRPVLYDADGHMLAYGRLSTKRLRKTLSTQGAIR